MTATDVAAQRAYPGAKIYVSLDADRYPGGLCNLRSVHANGVDSGAVWDAIEGMKIDMSEHARPITRQVMARIAELFPGAALEVEVDYR
jgi:hypothetical protein